MTLYHCSACKEPYPETGLPHLCPNCGGVFTLDTEIPFSEASIEKDQPGIWSYRHSFGIDDEALAVSLGEGGTPLVKSHAFDRPINFKLDFLNPSGSYKDRATTTLLTELVARGISSAVEDSSGNAGASFAAYSAKAEVAARVFIPDYASGPKRTQIKAYGAEVVPIKGPRSAATEAVLHAANEGAVYASHALLPFGLAGIATIAYELLEQLGQKPGTIVAPVGHGSLLLGISKGFEALMSAGIIKNSPKYVGVQARACAPIWAQSTSVGPLSNRTLEGETVAEGVRVSQPVRGEELRKVVASSQGTFIAVEEDKILSGRNALAQLGFYVEPTSAIVWDAIKQLPKDCPEPIVGLLTGSGLKSVE